MLLAFPAISPAGPAGPVGPHLSSETRARRLQIRPSTLHGQPEHPNPWPPKNSYTHVQPDTLDSTTAPPFNCPPVRSLGSVSVVYARHARPFGRFSRPASEEKTATGRLLAHRSTDHVLDAVVLCVAAPLTAVCLADPVIAHDSCSSSLRSLRRPCPLSLLAPSTCATSPPPFQSCSTFFPILFVQFLRISC